MPSKKAAHLRTNEEKALTKEQFLRAAEKRFEAMDLNKDGKVTHQEHREGVDRMRQRFEHDGGKLFPKRHGFGPEEREPVPFEDGRAR